MTLIYDITFFLFALGYFPYLIIRRKWHRGFKMRMGIFPKELQASLWAKKNIWVHAVSLGEVNAVLGLIRKMREQFPQHQIVLSTVTTTGHAMASQQLKKEAVVIYAPLDFSFVVKKYIALINPCLYIVTETEWWPNLLTALHRRGVAMVQVNGRVSHKSFKTYRRVRFLMKRVLKYIHAFCMQSPLDAERIFHLGGLQERTTVVGNLKFENLSAENTLKQTDLGFAPDDMLWIAGSTHPGEEEIILDIFRKLTADFKKLRLVVAPRHPERAPQVEELVKEKGFSPVKFSRIKDVALNDQSVTVVDTIGHLRSLYGLARIVFVGKSLKGQGGQNIIEPAFFAKPVCVGPHMQNFQDIMHLFLKEKAIIQVADGDDLYNQMMILLSNPEMIGKIGQRARGVIEKNQGALEKTMNVISRFVTEKVEV